MAKSFKDVVQDSPRTGLGIPVQTKNPLSRTNTKSVRPGLPFAATRPLGKPTSANQGSNKKISPPNDADSQVRPETQGRTMYLIRSGLSRLGVFLLVTNLLVTILKTRPHGSFSTSPMKYFQQ